MGFEGEECVSVGSGTAALELAVWALGLGPDDEVITQTNTFAATPMAIVDYTRRELAREVGIKRLINTRMNGESCFPS